MMRALLVLLICAAPAVAHAAATVTVTNSINPAGYPVVSGYAVLLEGSGYTISYGFNVTTTLTPSAVEATYEFGTRSGRLSASVNAGAISTTPLRFSNNLVPGDYKLNYTFTITYTNGSSETVKGTAPTGVRIMTGASSSVERLDFDPVMSGTQVTLGPITMTGGNSSGWSVQWSAGTPTGTNKASCRYTSVANEYKTNTVTATVTNTLSGSELYRQVYTFNIPTYATASASILGAPQAAYSGDTFTLHANVAGGWPDGWHYQWEGKADTDTPDYVYTVPAMVGSGSTMIRATMTNYAEDGTLLYTGTPGVYYTAYQRPTVTFSEVSSILRPGTNLSLNMNATGGEASKWAYQWRVDGTLVSTSSSYSYNHHQDGVKVVKITAQATNTPTGIAEPFVAKKEYVIIEIPDNGSSSSQTQQVAMFAGTPKTLKADLPVVEDPWVYQWWIDGGDNLAHGVNEIQFDRNVNQTTVFDVICRATSTISGQVIDVDTHFLVTVYPTPKATVTFEPEYDVVIPGETFKGSLEVSGGSPNDWHYSWLKYYGGQFHEFSTESSAEIIIPEYNSEELSTIYEGSKSLQVYYLAENSPEGVERYYLYEPRHFLVFPSPQFSYGNPQTSVVSGSSVEITVTGTGGQIWTYEWLEDGMTKVGDTNTLNVTPVNNTDSKITKTYKVIAKSLVSCGDIGDGWRVVAHEEHVFTVDVYPENMAVWGGSYPANIISGTKIPMTVVPSDGNAAGWTINWYINGAPITGASGANYTFQNTAAGQYVVTAKLQNRTNGLSYELSHTVTVYAAPTVTVAKDTYYVVSGDALTLSVDAQGAAEWHYQWYKNNQEIGEDSPQLTVQTFNDGLNVVKDTYHVNATSFLPGDERIGVETRYFTVNVYPETVARIERQYTNYLVGDQVAFNIRLSDNNPDNWNITWSVNGVVQRNETGTTLVMTPEVKGTYKVTAKLVNRQDADIELTLEAPLLEAYDRPKTSVDKDIYYIISGSPVTLKFNATGGESWSIKWYEEEYSPEGYMETTETPSLTLTPENTGENVIVKNYLADAYCYIPEGDVGNDYEQKYHFTVYIYPETMARFVGEQPANIIVNTPVEFSIAFADNNPDNWNISWYVNETRQSASGASYTFNSSVPGNFTVFAELESKIESNLNVELRAPAIQVYAAPAVSAATRNFTVISGSTVTMSIDATGGAYWKYKWAENGSAIAGDGSSLTITPVNEGNTVITKNYSVEATCYLPGDEFVHADAVDFTVTVYPAETARFADKYPTEILSGWEVPMSIVLADGNESDWDISWYVDAFSIPVATGTSYTFSRTAPGNYTVRAELKNRIESSLNVTLTAPTFAVFANPGLQNTQTSVDLYRYSPATGQSNTISFTENATNGFPDGWSWTVNIAGAQVASGTGASATYYYNVPRVDEPYVETVQMVFSNTNGDGFSENFEIRKTMHIYPEFKFELSADPDMERIAIGSQIAFTTSHSDAPGIWSYTWRLDGANQGNGDSYTYNAPAELENYESHTVSVTARLTSEYEGMSRDVTVDYPFEVWPDGTITSKLVQETGIAPGMPLNIGVNVIGTIDGWTFEWQRDGVAFENNLPFWSPEFTEAEIGSRVTFTVHATFERDGVVSFDDTYTIYVNVYNLPVCSVGENIIAYIGDTVTQTVSYSGLNPDGWHVEWYVMGQTGSGQSFEFELPTTMSENYPFECFAKIVNEAPGGTVIYDENYYFTVTGYSKGNAYYTSRPSTPDFLYRAGEPVVIGVEGGYPEGWTYRWYSTDGGFDVMGGSSFTPETVNSGNSNMTLLVYVEITNSIGDNVGYRATGSYEYILWPQAEVSAPILSRRNMRNGERVDLSVSTSGANPDGWRYSWHANNSFVSNSEEFTYVPVPLINGNPLKTTTTFNYSVEVSNYGPQNQNWFTETTPTTGLNVYNRPAMPTELLVKGDGTSRTLIAMMSQSDANLESQGYAYVFGYSDATGDHALAATGNRYNHFATMTTSQFNSLRYDMWVYTQWTYPDGSVVTSGKRYIGGNYDDEFDASVYTGGRGDTAGIEAIEVGDLWSDGYSFRAEPAQPSTATVKVYSSTGMIVRILEYPEQSSFDERIEFGGLATGMYVVEIRTGNLRTVKKVVVDNK